MVIEQKYNENRNKKPSNSDTWLGNYLNINYKSIGVWDVVICSYSDNE